MLVAALPLPDDGSTGVDILEQGQALFNLDCAATTLSVGACAKVIFGDESEFGSFDVCTVSLNTTSLLGWCSIATFITTRIAKYSSLRAALYWGNSTPL